MISILHGFLNVFIRDVSLWIAYKNYSGISDIQTNKYHAIDKITSFSVILSNVHNTDVIGMQRTKCCVALLLAYNFDINICMYILYIIPLIHLPYYTKQTNHLKTKHN